MKGASHNTLGRGAGPRAVLVSNGPGELYTWVRPVLAELRARWPEARASIHLIPCQFASGHEAEIARTFGADEVHSPAEFLKLVALGGRQAGEGGPGFVLSLGGSTGMALRLAGRLGYPAYRYSFEPIWHPRLRRLFVHDARAERRARLLGAPKGRLELVGNLVADAVAGARPAAGKGRPHVYLNPGSRDGFALHLIPFMIALTDLLGASYPGARFVWPLSRMLSQEAVAAGIAGRERATLGGAAGRREGEVVLTPGGHRLEIIAEEERYAHMQAADLAVTIPGTNTLELGLAGVPSIVMLPLNRPEAIPLEGLGHWLGLVPLIGTSLKRQAVRLAAPHLPVALPNSLSGEELMVEIKGVVDLETVAARSRELLDAPEEMARRRRRLLETMPPAGAARKLLDSVARDLVPA